MSGSPLASSASSSWRRVLAPSPRTRRSSPATSCPRVSTDCRAPTRRPRRRCTTPSHRSSTTSRSNDLFTDFKSEKLGVDTDGPDDDRERAVPRRHDHPRPLQRPARLRQDPGRRHRAAGWIAAEDRGLLLAAGPLQLARRRHRRSRAERDRPDRRACRPSSRAPRRRPSSPRRPRPCRTPARRARRSSRDIDTYIAGINAYLAAPQSPNAPWTRNDVYAVNALKGQFLGQGGGDEARRSEFLGGLQQQLGADQRLRASSTTCASSRTRRAPPRSTARSRTGTSRRSTRAASSSTTTASRPLRPCRASVAAQVAPRADAGQQRADGRPEHSTTGHPILVGGPQIGYFFPGLVLEIDMHAPASTGAAPPRRRSRATC